ncbi:DUF533 domain-containing protein [Bosea sp. CS1GBMeth4]|uniref:tellurite resistance TerB family protein n=1 Tax=Bosea sp. CS1GBMeth4 TaxID=1892849 RepID=UPI0016471971|nr:DUF533 domain-containing protein [Bosea sp. CS1GBMeth4]
MFNAKSLLDALVNAGSQIGAQGGQSGGLGGILGNLAEQARQAGGSGGLAGMAGQILGQATQGVQDAARNTGVQQGATDIVGQLSGGRTPEQLLEQARGMLGNNQLAAGAVLGGLGALIFGTSAGRSLAGSAARIGGLALIGGLAYKAYQNYQAGKPLLGADQAALPAPSGSGFEPEAARNEHALLFIRAMIAASASDGHIDDAERNAILGGLNEAGLDAEAGQWLANELANPASVDALVEGAESPELAAQIYTAARIAINPDTPAEKDFLAGLAGSLGLDAELVANIDAAASAAKV